MDWMVCSREKVRHIFSAGRRVSKDNTSEVHADETLSIKAQGQFSFDIFSRNQISIFQIMQQLLRWVF